MDFKWWQTKECFHIPSVSAPATSPNCLWPQHRTGRLSCPRAKQASPHLTRLPGSSASFCPCDQRLQDVNSSGPKPFYFQNFNQKQRQVCMYVDVREETEKWITLNDLFKLQFCGWGYKNEDVAVSLRWTSSLSNCKKQWQVSTALRPASSLPSWIRWQNAVILEQCLSEHRMPPNAQPGPTWKRAQLHQVTSRSFLYCLHGSKTVALKMAMKSVAVSWTLPLCSCSGLDKGGPQTSLQESHPEEARVSHSPDSYKGLYFNCKLHRSAFFQPNMVSLLYLLINPHTPPFQGSQERESLGGDF